jgi:hypothetical protein
MADSSTAGRLPCAACAERYSKGVEPLGSSDPGGSVFGPVAILNDRGGRGNAEARGWRVAYGAQEDSVPKVASTNRAAVGIGEYQGVRPRRERG